MTDHRRCLIRSATETDWVAIGTLLQACALPLDGARETLAHFLVAEQNGTIVGCAGWEPHGDVALLRSCAVDARMRGSGLGRTLAQRAVESARTHGIRQLVLLTTTAEHFFPRFGFVPIARDDTPEALKASAEFRYACPASATVMQLTL